MQITNVDTVPAWVETLKADIREIVKSQLATGLRKSCEEANEGQRAGSLSACQACSPAPAESSRAEYSRVNLEFNFESQEKSADAMKPTLSHAEKKSEDHWRQTDLKHLTQNIEGQTSHKQLGMHFPYPFNCFFNCYFRWLQFLHSQKMPETMLARFVCSRGFQFSSLFVIFANTVWIVIDIQHDEYIDDPEFESNATILKWMFTMLFIVELVLKVLGLQWMFIGGIDWRWNMLDFAVVAMSLPALVTQHVNPTIGRILRLCRVVRFLKLLRIGSLFLEMRRMVVALWGSMWTLFWCATMFAVFQFIFAILIMQTIRLSIYHKPSLDVQKMQDIQVYYGSLPRTMLTLWYVLSGGDWADVSAPLVEIWAGYDYVMAAYVFFMLIGIMNVGTGLFCENAVRAIQSDRALSIAQERDNADSFIREMTNIFHEIDANSSGEVNWTAFESYISAEDIRCFLSSHGLPVHDAAQLFRLIDEIDGEPSGAFDLSSFVMAMQRLCGGAKGTDLVMMLVQTRRLVAEVRNMPCTLEQAMEKKTKLPPVSSYCSSAGALSL